MKPIRLLFCAFLAPLAPLPAQEPSAAPAPVLTDLQAESFTDEQLETMLGPIALYPDALIALILPAATEPTDVVLAARYVKDRGTDLSQVEHRAWDDSVKSLTHYPEVIKWMDENLPWTKQVGEAFARQPADVMNAIQRLRARARAAGALVDTPQQQVLAEPTVIRIVPADPEIIYVPYYDPAVVFVSTPVYYSRPLLRFGAPCRVGSWLAYDFDWHRSTLWIGDRHRHWAGRHDWRRPVVPIATVMTVQSGYRASRPWTPPARPGHGRSFDRPGNPDVRASNYPTVTAPIASRPGNPGYRNNSQQAIPRAPSLNRVTAPVQNPTVVPATPPIVASQPLAYRSSTPDAERPTVRPARSYQPRSSPVASTVPAAPPIQAAPPMQIAPPTHVAPSASRATRSFPTVVAPAPSPQPNPGASSRTPPPVAAPALQVQGRSTQPAATEPSAPAATSSTPPPPARAQSGPQLRGRRGDN